MYTKGFFHTKIADNQKIAQFVDVGKDNDCAFRAIAVSIVDKAIDKPADYQNLLHNIFITYFNYFPLGKTNSPLSLLLTPFKRMCGMIETTELTAEFIRNLAFVLRQITVDELVSNPVRYQMAFKGTYTSITPKQMRLPTTKLDKTALAALSFKLNLPLIIQILEPNKELPRQLTYNLNQNNLRLSRVVIQLQNSQYLPELLHYSKFKMLATQKLPAFKFKQNSTSDDPELSEIHSIIKEDESRLLADFEKNLSCLNDLVESGELNKEQLLGIYIKEINNSDYLKTDQKYVGTEHSHQHFFETIKTTSKPISLSKDRHEKQIIDAIVNGIARAQSINSLNKTLSLHPTIDCVF